MVRKPFTLIAALIGLSSLVGAFAPVRSKADVARVDYANTFVSDNTWAGANDTPSLYIYGYGMNWYGNTTGSFYVGTSTWGSSGIVLNASCYQDAQGEHTDVLQYVLFTRASNDALTAYIPALEKFHVLKLADGTLSEAAEVFDFQGNAIADTGKDANGALQMLPVMRGGIFTAH